MPQSIPVPQAPAASTPDRSDTVPRLQAVRYRLRLRAETRAHLPAYAGSAWRGAFGHALKRTVCVTREPRCPDCLLYRSCLYPYLFETPPPADAAKMRRYPAAPHPFVLEPEPPGARDLEPGDTTELGLVLLGGANAQLAYFVHALEQAAQGGVGRGRGRFRLEAVEGEAGPGHWVPVYRPGGRLTPLDPEPPAVPPSPESLTLEIDTPLRLQQDGRLVGPGELGFGALFATLLRRVSMLTYFHGERPLETDFRALIDAARAREIRHRELRWHEWTRYSSRQGREVQMGGLLGRLSLDGPGLEPFWPFLWLGQWCHVGKGTVMGLGRYRISRKLAGEAAAE